MGKNLNFLRILLLTVTVVGIPTVKLVSFSYFRGLDFEKCLSSDAESWIFHIAQPEIPNTQTKNFSYVELFLQFLGQAARVTGKSVFSMSIFFSWACSIIFGIFCFKIAQMFIPFGLSVLFSALCLFETHVLGGTTFGCAPFGILPREAALTMAVLILYIKLHNNINKSKISEIAFLAIYGATGFLFYFYPPQGLGLFLLIFGVDLLGVRKIKNLNLLLKSLLVFGVIITPFALTYLLATKNQTPVDPDILKQRNSFMLLTGFDSNTFLYLRRFLYQSVILILAGIYILRKKPNLMQFSKFHILKSFLFVSFVISVAGMTLEINPNLVKLFISRGSIFYALFFYLFCLFALNQCFAAKSKNFRKGFSLIIIILLVVNTNLSGFYRQCRAELFLRKKTLEFFSIIDRHKIIEDKKHVFLVSYSPERDYAAMFRTYSGKRVFVCDKEGGVSLVDGEMAKDWAKRQNIQKQIFSLSSLYEVKKFAKEINVTYLILDVESNSISTQLQKELRNISLGRFFVEIQI